MRQSHGSGYRRGKCHIIPGAVHLLLPNLTVRVTRMGRESINATATCTTVTFPDLGANALVIAAQNSRNEDDGGWVRRCATVPTSNSIGLAIDENVDPAVAGDSRDHITEKVGLIAFSTTFSSTLAGGPGFAYLYQI